MNKTRNKREAITDYFTEIKKIRWEYYEQHFADKLDNVGKIEKNPKKIKTTKSEQQQELQQKKKKEYMNRCITNEEIKLVSKNLLIKTSLPCYTNEFNQSLSIK